LFDGWFDGCLMISLMIGLMVGLMIVSGCRLIAMFSLFWNDASPETRRRRRSPPTQPPHFHEHGPFFAE
jgi:hypothetical protein